MTSTTKPSPALAAALRRSARLLAPPANDNATRQLAKHRLHHDLDAAIRLAVLGGEDSVALILVDAEIALRQSLQASALEEGIARVHAEQGLPSPAKPEPSKSRRAWKPTGSPGERARKRARKRGAHLITM